MRESLMAGRGGRRGGENISFWPNQPDNESVTFSLKEEL